MRKLLRRLFGKPRQPPKPPTFPIRLSSLPEQQLRDYWGHELYIDGQLITEKMVIDDLNDDEYPIKID